MAEKGLVTQVKGQYVVVQMVRLEACDHCRACTMGMEGKEMIIEAENECNAKVGDYVNVSIEQTNFLKAVLIMYTIPLAALLIGIGSGYVIGQLTKINWSEYLSIILGFGFVAITYWIIRKNEPKFKNKKYRPKAIEVVE